MKYRADYVTNSSGSSFIFKDFKDQDMKKVCEYLNEHWTKEELERAIGPCGKPESRINYWKPEPIKEQEFPWIFEVCSCMGTTS